MGSIGSHQALRRIAMAVAGLILAGCTASSPTANPSGSPVVMSSTVVPTPIETLSSMPIWTPRASSSPTDSAICGTAVICRLKSVDISGFETTSDPAASKESFDIEAVGARAVLSYEGPKAKGSVIVPLTPAELACLANTLCDAGDLYADDGYVLVLTQAPQSVHKGVPCGMLEPPVHWRILAARLDQNGKPGAFTEFATGASNDVYVGPANGGWEGYDCPYTLPPRLSLSGDLVAYNVETPTAANPFGAQIFVRSLVDNSTLRQLTIAQAVLSLQLSGTNLIWMEWSGRMSPRSLPLRLSTAASPNPHDVLTFTPPKLWWNYPSYRLVGNLLVWEGSSTGKMWLRDVTSTADPIQVSPTGAVCLIDDFDGANVAMSCGTSPTMTTWEMEVEAVWPVFWSPTSGDRALTGQPWGDVYARCAFYPGVLAVYTYLRDDATKVYLVPLPTLTDS
jgi:hypothetical protein